VTTTVVEPGPALSDGVVELDELVELVELDELVELVELVELDERALLEHELIAATPTASNAVDQRMRPVWDIGRSVLIMLESTRRAGSPLLRAVDRRLAWLLTHPAHAIRSVSSCRCECSSPVAVARQVVMRSHISSSRATAWSTATSYRSVTQASPTCAST